MKALVIAPKFFGYDKAIVRGLKEKGYEVDLMDSEQLKPEYWKCWNKSFIHKAARHLIPGRRDRDRKKADKVFSQKYLGRYTEQTDEKHNAYSLILTVKGDFLQDRFYEYLHDNNPDARFVLYLWDDVRLLHRKDYFHYFDMIFSYNIEDCKKHGWTYLPIFIQNRINAEHEKEYDIAIIGSAHGGRVRLAKRIYHKYKDKYKFFIYLVEKDNDENHGFFEHKKPLTYEEYLEYMGRSKVIVDIPAKNQTGPTTRLYDACLSRTKVITTNSHMVFYPIYGENIHVINRLFIRIPGNFVRTPFVDEKKEIMEPELWVDCILEIGQ